MISKMFRWHTLGGYLLLAVLLSIMLPTVQAQDTNLCRDGGALNIAYDETLTGTLSVDFPVQFYCFDAERGDEVTVSVVATSGSIVPAVVVATPFLGADGLLVDTPLAEGAPTDNVAAIDVSANIDSDGQYLIIVQTLVQAEGTFDITVEASGGNVLLGSEDSAEGDGSDDSTDTNDADTGQTTPDTSVPGQQTLCDFEDTINLEIDATTTSELDAGIPAVACFDALEGDVVSIDIETTDGGAAVGFLIVTPLYDGSPTAPTFGQGIADTADQIASTDFLVQQSGTYSLLILSRNGEAGTIDVTLSAEVGTIYTCDSDPLSLITGAEWGVFNETDDAPILRINIGCSDLLAVTTMGQAEVSSYFVEQDDTFLFSYQDTVFATVSLTAEEWVIADAFGTQFTLNPLSEPDQCTDALSLSLIRGSWQWTTDPNQTLILDFTCNGTVIVDDLSTEERFTVGYTVIEDEDGLSIDVDGLVFENVEIGDGNLSMALQGTDYVLTNRLYNEEAEASEEETEEADNSEDGE